MKIVDDAGNDLPRDGSVSGNMVVRGPWIVKGYIRATARASSARMTGSRPATSARSNRTAPWLITDRSKDVIKSGGEWISSIDIENAAMGHPASPKPR